ncbi:MAG TPA: hypothetical protein VGG28_13035 [Kofleriaceae bacterium]
MREHRGSFGAVRHQAIRALASDASIDERALRSRGREHAAVQLRDHRRLEQDVVGAGVEARVTHVVAVFAAEHGDPNGRSVQLFEPAYDDQARCRHVEVDEREVRSGVFGDRDRRRAVLGGHDVKADAGQRCRGRPAHARVVVYDEDARTVRCSDLPGRTSQFWDL